MISSATVERLSNGENGYQGIDRSRFLPPLDLDLIVACMDVATQTEAVRQLRRAMRA